MSSIESGTLSVPPLTAQQFSAVRRILYDVAGITLNQGKENLVRGRLARRIRELGLSGFSDYLEHVSVRGSDELPRMIDALTTNKTSFFREPRHFDCLRETVLPPLLSRRAQIRIWSAGCSSGEEPYTLASVIASEAGSARPDARILATDISDRMLARARAGLYDDEVVAGMPQGVLRTHFERVNGPRPQWSVKDELRSMVRFAKLNLMEEWPMRGPFDVIFCRNVMIYFDKQTQARLILRFQDMLGPGGFLFVGHSESLSGVDHAMKYVQPAVYMR